MPGLAHAPKWKADPGPAAGLLSRSSTNATSALVEAFRLPDTMNVLVKTKAAATLHRLAAHLLVLLTAALILPGPALASLPDHLAEIGYQQLIDELGGEPLLEQTAPLTQVEAAESEGDRLFSWFPDPGDERLSGNTIINRLVANEGRHSGHATVVGSLFYGSHSLLANRQNLVYAYPMRYWATRGFLQASTAAEEPRIAGSRVANHSWIGSMDTPEGNVMVLKRLDWVVEKDDFIQCVGTSNHGDVEPLLESAFNVIVAGVASGGHGTGTLDLDPVYVKGRTRPHVVVPVTATSNATAVVSSAAALLVDLGHSRPGLSLEEPATNRFGDLVYPAENSETIKAAILAGADRVPRDPNHTGIADYGLIPGRMSENGLDPTYGAGQLNIRNGWHIIAAGEQNSDEDGGVAIGPEGFDYDPHFGGAGCNGTGTYTFRATGTRPELTASLVWNAEIEDIHDALWETVIVRDLDLELFDVTTGREVAQSKSRLDNSENLWVPLTSGHEYRITVQVAENREPFDWDYSLAWRVDEAPERSVLVPGPGGRYCIVAALGLLFLGGSIARKKKNPAPEQFPQE